MENLIRKLIDDNAALNARIMELELEKKPKPDPYQSEQVNELYTALSKAQGSYPVIGTNCVNPHFKSNYADLDTILHVIRPILEKHGLSLAQPTKFGDDGSTILYTRVCHSSGQWMESRARILPVRNTIQDYGSTLSYNKRYQACALLGITVARDPLDDDAEVAMITAREVVAKGPSNKYNPKDQSYDTITKEQIEELEYELADAPDLAEHVLDKLGLQALADMPKSKYMVSLQRIREIKLMRNNVK